MWVIGKNSPIYLVLVGWLVVFKGTVILSGSFWGCSFCHTLKV